MLYERILERLKVLKISERAASLQATGNADAIRYIRTRGAMPSSERLFALGRVLEADPAYLLGEVDTNNWDAYRDKMLDEAGGIEQLRESIFDEVGKLSEEALDIFSAPMLYSESIGSELFSTMDKIDLSVATFSVRQEAIDIVAAPHGFKGSALACAMNDGSMSPLYEAGEAVVFDWGTPASSGDVAFLQLQSASPSDGDPWAYCCLVRKLIGKTASHLIVRQYNPLSTFQIPLHRVHGVSRVFSLKDYVKRASNAS